MIIVAGWNKKYLKWRENVSIENSLMFRDEWNDDVEGEAGQWTYIERYLVERVFRKEVVRVDGIDWKIEWKVERVEEQDKKV